jgi:hypothetical protein
LQYNIWFNLPVNTKKFQYKAKILEDVSSTAIHIYFNKFKAFFGKEGGKFILGSYRKNLVALISEGVDEAPAKIINIPGCIYYYSNLHRALKYLFFLKIKQMFWLKYEIRKGYFLKF